MKPSLTGNMNSTDLILDNKLEHFSWWFKVPIVTYLLTISSIGVPGNIIVAIIYSRELSKSACDWLILTMSITDAFVCFCSPALYIRSCLRIPLPWKANFLCTLEYWLQLTAMFASCLLLAIIALDRYAKICRPGLSSLTPTMARNVCGITVVISASICLAPFFGGIMDSYCYISEIRETTVTKIFFTSIFGCYVVSFFIVTFAYASVCKKINQKIKLKQKLLENNGLNLSAKQENKQEAKTYLFHRINLWHQILKFFPAKLNMRRRTQNKNQTEGKTSNEFLYSNANTAGSGDNRYNNANLSYVEDYGKTGFRSTDVKIEVSEAEIMLCDRPDNKWHSRRETSEAKSHLAVQAVNLHSMVAEEYTCQELITDPDHATGLENKAVPVLHNIGGIEDGVFLHRCDEKEFIRTDTEHNTGGTLLLHSYTRNDSVGNINCSCGSGLAREGLADFGANQTTQTASKKTCLNTNGVDSCRKRLNTDWGSISRESMGDTNLLSDANLLLRVNRYFGQNGLDDSVDERDGKHDYLTVFSYNGSKGDSCVLKHNNGNKSRKCRSFCLPPRQSYFYDDRLDITSANSHPDLHVTDCHESDAGLWFSISDRLNAKQLTRNCKEDNDSIGVRSPHKLDLLIPAPSNDELGHVVSRAPFSYTSCTGCFQNSFFSCSVDECSCYSLEANKRLIKSEPCLLVPPSDGHQVTFDRNMVSKTQMPHPTSDSQCAFKTTRSPSEVSVTSPQLPRQSQSSHLRPHPADLLKKNISDGNRTSSVQFPLGSSTFSLKDTPSRQTDKIRDYLDTGDTNSVLLSLRIQNVPQQTDETFERHDYLETTNNTNVPHPRSLKPTGSTTSRRSNKSSKFADPATIALMVDNSFIDDKSEVLSGMSPFKKPRTREGCRTSRRSRSSVKSSTSCKLRFARERQMTFMLLSVTAAFLLSWIPPWIMYMSCLYGPLECEGTSVIHYLATIHLLNYVASPVIYFTFNPRFRSKASQLFAHLKKCHCCRGKESFQWEFSSSPI